MTCAFRMFWPLLATTALLLQACSSPSVANTADNMSSQDEVLNRSEGIAAEDTGFAPGESASDVGRALCMDRASQRFGIAPNDGIGSTFAGGGDSPRTVEAQVTLTLPTAPARSFRCEIQGGVVVSIGEVDDNGDPIVSRD